MASIRKIKKALKREIRRIDGLLLKSPQEQTSCLSMYDWWASASDMWDLFLWRNYFERKIKSLGKDDFDPWTGESHKPIPSPPKNMTRLSVTKSKE